MKQRQGLIIKIDQECLERISKGECPTCGKPKKDWTRRKDWRCCSNECTSKFEKDKILRSWAELRTKAIERDKFTCVKCGKRPEQHYSWLKPKNISKEEYYQKRFIREHDGGSILASDSGLIGDHIIPIALGGDEWDINNVQTLCTDCNKIKTADDIKKIAAQRAIEKKQQSNNQLPKDI